MVNEVRLSDVAMNSYLMTQTRVRFTVDNFKVMVLTQKITE